MWASLSTTDETYNGCTDLTLANGNAWQDSDGTACSAYANDKCNSKGTPLNAGAEWGASNPTWRFPQKVSTNGLTAAAACCACGG
eukprot:SAG31_NODE_46252_length_255_cov_0.666667_1_plen_84_part_11